MPIYQGKKHVLVTEAVLHCAGVRAGWMAGFPARAMVSEIDRWHRERGWAGIGYHYVIAPSGEVGKGRDVSQVPASVMGHNYGTLAILLVESAEISRIGRFENWFNPEQRAAVKRLLAMHSIKKVSGHNDYAAKLCPGFKVKSYEWAPPDLASI